VGEELLDTDCGEFGDDGVYLWSDATIRRSGNGSTIVLGAARPSRNAGSLQSHMKNGCGPGGPWAGVRSHMMGNFERISVGRQTCDQKIYKAIFACW
jgi:hypothetical protein